MRFTSSFPVALLGEAGLGERAQHIIHINARVFATDRLRLTHQRVIVASTSPKYYFIQVRIAALARVMDASILAVAKAHVALALAAGTGLLEAVTLASARMVTVA